MPGMDTEYIYRNIKVALADMIESGEDMDVQLNGATLVVGRRMDGAELVPAVEAYVAGATAPSNTWYVVTDAYNALSDVLERVATQVASFVDGTRRPL